MLTGELLSAVVLPIHYLPFTIHCFPTLLYDYLLFTIYYLAVLVTDWLYSLAPANSRIE